MTQAPTRWDRRSGFTDLFQAGTKADVSGVSKGKGFAGVMERHNFSGQGASARQPQEASPPVRSAPVLLRLVSSRAPGMAGRLGGERVTTLNIEIVGVDGERESSCSAAPFRAQGGSVALVREAVKAHG